ncbi:F0F1 ATP synthase subunit B [Guyparkeria sp.]|uniref:F0F1 ATP synthase subunit B family protein n=1 Tax=Guyparkeria sp. TaxID=2035736 RepID=UPI00356963EB
MLIDWFTVGAQIVNFAVLLWLLKRFLYRPVLNALDAREKRIADRLEQAERSRQEAERERQSYEDRNAVFEREREDRLDDVRREADAERHRLLAEAREAAETLRKESERSLRNETRRLSDEIIRRARDEVMALVRRALADLADADVEEAMARSFIARLRTLDASQTESLAAAVERGGEPVRIRSAFPLSETLREAVRDAVEGVVATRVPLEFETADDVIAGIELVAPGEKLAWSLEEYLHEFEQRLAELPVDPEEGDETGNRGEATA